MSNKRNLAVASFTMLPALYTCEPRLAAAEPDVSRQASATVTVPGNACGALGNPRSGGVPLVPALAISGPGTITISYVSGTVTDSSGINTGPDGVTWDAGSAQSPLEEAQGVAGGTINNLDALIGVFVPQTKVVYPGFSPVDGTKDLVPVGVVPSELAFIGSQTRTLKAKIAGTLFLGINDWACADNGGSFTVSVAAN